MPAQTVQTTASRACERIVGPVTLTVGGGEGGRRGTIGRRWLTVPGGGGLWGDYQPNDADSLKFRLLV